MPKFSSKELSSRINDLDIPEDVKMSLIEDITDSVIDESERISQLQSDLDSKAAEVDKITSDYNGLYDKYKSRFMESTSDGKDMKEDIEIPDMVQENVIDIKSII